ncbi:MULTISPECIES: Fur family transcriptional regulator [Hydrocarboniphaga]|jgi:Fur family zinc uptake transcriptional regulator|uniref:Ferric uptake regulation protein n=1 Tax=Hydrocarboniphaga effusa AP103 TaxID=1172194 RepID=I8T535_9GAMM|nr:MULTISPECIES: Fur family transcriptional regulator [Hydrocarboniphaga]EIT69010.1 hypothetical protein WQQ_25920 [Hydrocarboniphaga effusa AP103]MDZ4081110.1 Fur family transcriptional regulator [Hydrocarboniphaga sp.]
MPAKPAAKRKRPAPSDLAAPLLRRAEKRCAEAGEQLTPARINAYAELVAQGRAVSAYELLALLETREGRKLAPLTVYRQLEFLTRVGLVHRLASTQSFLVCEHPDHPHEGLYLVCSSCGRADELESDSLTQLIGKAAKSRGFKSEKRIVEVQGTCHDCAEKQ